MGTSYTGKKRIGIFGGAFDPPHAAHVMVATYALCCANIDELIIIPCASHPFDKNMTSFELRFKMAELAFSYMSDRIHIDPIESKLPYPSYTYNTVVELRKKYKDSDFVLIIGSDNAEKLDKWYKIEELKQLVEFFVVERAGKGIISFPPVSSTLIRERVRRGLSIDGLVPEKVQRIIRQEGLYTP